jgi:hypothetical protein
MMRCQSLRLCDGEPIAPAPTLSRGSAGLARGVMTIDCPWLVGSRTVSQLRTP